MTDPPDKRTKPPTARDTLDMVDDVRASDDPISVLRDAVVEGQRAARAFALSGVWHITYDPADGRIVSCNERMRDVLGYDPTGALTTDLIHPDDVDATLAAWDLVRANRPVQFGFPNRYRRSDGHYVAVLWSPPHAGDTAVGIVVEGSPILADALTAEWEKRRA